MSAGLSRAELEAMDKQELIDTILDLQSTVEDLELRVEALGNGLETANAERKQMRAESDDLSERLDELEAENERLRSRVNSTGGKDEKVAAIVEHADNLRNSNDRAVKLTAKDIKGATGVSRRYAYDLMDPEDDNSLINQYDWALTQQEMAQYGSLELDLSGQQKCIGIDFEGVHSAGCPVNKFTTAQEGEDPS
jgi:regulator of replication initiation timing